MWVVLDWWGLYEKVSSLLPFYFATDLYRWGFNFSFWGRGWQGIFRFQVFLLLSFVMYLKAEFLLHKGYLILLFGCGKGAFPCICRLIKLQKKRPVFYLFVNGFYHVWRPELYKCCHICQWNSHYLFILKMYRTDCQKLSTVLCCSFTWKNFNL